MDRLIQIRIYPNNDDQMKNDFNFDWMTMYNFLSDKFSIYFKSHCGVIIYRSKKKMEYLLSFIHLN